MSHKNQENHENLKRLTSLQLITGIIFVLQITTAKFPVTHAHIYICVCVEGFSVNNLIKTCKIIFIEYRLPREVVKDAGTNFISEKFENVCKRLGIYHTISLSYNYQSNEQAESCIKFVKRSMKKCYEIYIYVFTGVEININQFQVTTPGYTPI